jgi:plastocyanin
MGDGAMKAGSKTTVRRIVVIAVAALGLFAVSAPTMAARTRIKATDDRTWSPDFKHVVPGTKVIWKNGTNLTHTVTAYGGGWSKNSTVTAGTKTSKKFRKEGTFRYRCTIHSTVTNGDCNGMCGTIHVAT